MRFCAGEFAHFQLQTFMLNVDLPSVELAFMLDDNKLDFKIS